MAGTYYPLKDAEYSTWLANFLTVANVNLIPHGLVAGDLTPIKIFFLFSLYHFTNIPICPFLRLYI